MKRPTKDKIKEKKLDHYYCTYCGVLVMGKASLALCHDCYKLFKKRHLEKDERLVWRLL